MDNETFKKEYLGTPDFNSITIEDVKKHLQKNERFSEVTGRRLEDHRRKFDGWQITVRQRDEVAALIELKACEVERLHKYHSGDKYFDIKEHIEKWLIRILEEQKSKKRNNKKYFIH